MRSIVLFLLLLLISANLFASPGVEIRGIVSGQDGSPLPGAMIVLKGNTERSKTVTADFAGAFQFTNVQPGEYIIEAALPGFKKASALIVVDGITAVPSVALQLAISGVDESVTVSAAMEFELEKVPGGTALIPEQEIQESKASNLKDVVNFTPGVFAQSRFGADESQFSIRGSGLRNNFHMRGLNILVNGIPYQDADGFSDFESIDLMATQHIEVWKGANALRYGGNSMGGAINFVTNTGEKEPALKLKANGGSFGSFKGQISSGGLHGPFDYYVSFSSAEMNGFRDHSDQSRQRLFGNFGWKLDDRTVLKWDIVYADVSEKLPGALTREEFDKNPKQADPTNVIGDWGRTYDYVRLGSVLKRQLNESHEVELIGFGQYRNMDHPIFQILDQDARNFGAEFRYRFNGEIAGKEMRFAAGFAPTYGTNSERRYENLRGDRGSLTALFRASAQNNGFYFENQLDLTSQTTLLVGARYDRSKREFDDRFLTDGDRSDRKIFRAFSPKLGILWKPDDRYQIFANASRSYEPPLLLELTSFGSAGFLNLNAQDTWQFEIGTRGTNSKGLQWDVSIYDAEINNELININVRPFPSASFTIPSYRNVENSRHSGIEAGASLAVANGISARAAYTYSRFRFVNDPDFGNNDLPGAPHQILRLETRFEKNNWWIAPNIDWSPSNYFLDSANTITNENYFVVNLKAGYRWNDLLLYLEGANLADEIYSGSTQVDNAAGRYFEPSNGRAFFAGVQWEL